MIVASAAARFSDYGFWLCPRRGSRRAGLPCQPHIRRDCNPNHCPAFGTGEPKGGRHHSVKTGQIGPTPDNGDVPLDQRGWATACSASSQIHRADHEAGFIVVPSGTTPCVTNRHRAISSLRASATIITFRTRVPVTPARLRYQCTRAAARLVALPQPSQFNHYSPKPTVAGLADPLFAFNATTVEGRCARDRVRSERFANSKATHEGLAHEDGRTLRANTAQRCRAAGSFAQPYPGLRPQAQRPADIPMQRSGRVRSSRRSSMRTILSRALAGNGSPSAVRSSPRRRRRLRRRGL